MISRLTHGYSRWRQFAPNPVFARVAAVTAPARAPTRAPATAATLEPAATVRGGAAVRWLLWGVWVLAASAASFCSSSPSASPS